MPVYPAAMSSLPAPMMVPGRWQPARATAAVLCFVMLVLVLSGLFLPLYSGTMATAFSEGDGLSQSIEITLTPWGLEFSDERLAGLPGSDVPRFGYPLVFAAVAIACAAAVCWYAATPTAGRTASRAAGVVTAVSGAFLLGIVWTVALVISNGIDYVLLMGTLSEELETSADYLSGYWLLITATVLGVAATVLSLIPAKQPPPWQPPPPVNPFVATPPYGIALPMHAPQAGPPAMHIHVPAGPPGGPVGPPIPPSPQGGVPVAQPLTVDPLTGEPLTLASPPTGVPAPVQPQPFTPEPVGAVNGTHAPVPVQPPAPVEPPASVAPPANNEPAPIVIPAAPPPPETPPGPAIPATEDPLAEPPRS
jgi:hypothetical protein